jgi:hypothetical protein
MPRARSFLGRIFTVFLGCLTISAQCQGDEPLWSPDGVAQKVDELVRADWERAGLVPSPRSGDEEFCRRVWLDLAGVAPSVGDLRAFLADPSTDKRPRLIDQLLVSPLHARHMAALWLDVLLKDAANDPTGSALPLEDWLRQQFQKNVRYDLFVADFMTAGGAQNVGPAVFYTSLDVQPERIAAETSRIFLGLQLQCAQCHDHPTDDWKQTDFWNYAAFFSQLQRSEPGMNQQVYLVDRSNRELTVPDSDEVALPRYPGIAEPPEPDIDNNRRRQLTVWMASRDNRYMIRTAVDRVWSHLMGRSLLEADHRVVMTLLEEEFVAQRFDLRKLYSIIARTEAYGRTSKITSFEEPTSAEASDLVTALPMKTLTPRQYYDSLVRNIYRQPPVLGTRPDNPDEVMRMQQRFMFLARMRTTNSGPTEYPHGLVQALGLLNGPEIGQVTGDQSRGLITAVKAPFFTDAQKVDVLYLSTLSRMPRPDESERCLQYLVDCETEAEKAEVLADILWTLLNTTECMVCP